MVGTSIVFWTDGWREICLGESYCLFEKVVEGRYCVRDDSKLALRNLRQSDPISHCLEVGEFNIRWLLRPSTLASHQQERGVTVCAFRTSAPVIRPQHGTSEHFGAGIEAFSRRIMVEEIHAFPQEFWELFLQSNLTALREKKCLVCVGMT